MVKIACQTIVYTQLGIAENYAGILKNIRDNGYDGVETGTRYLDTGNPGFYRELLAKYNLDMYAIHVGGDFLNRNSVEEQIEGVAKTIGLAKNLGSRYIFLSGAFNKDGMTRDDFFHQAKTYTRIGRLCSEAGLTFCYHNHWWEFLNNMIGMNILLDNVPEDVMKLVPDLGWVVIGGVDPVKFLKWNIDRVAVLHYKDFKSTELTREFTELGTGIVPFKAITDYLSTLGRDWWITAEQDVPNFTPEKSSKINCDYIKYLGNF